MKPGEDFGESMWRRHRQTAVTGRARTSFGEGLHAQRLALSSMLMRRGVGGGGEAAQRPLVVARRGLRVANADALAGDGPVASPHAVSALPRVEVMSVPAGVAREFDVSPSRVHDVEMARAGASDGALDRAVVARDMSAGKQEAHVSSDAPDARASASESSVSSDGHVAHASLARASGQRDASSSPVAMNMPIAQSVGQSDVHRVDAPTDSDARTMRLARAFAASVTRAESASQMTLARSAALGDGGQAVASRDANASDSISSMPLASMDASAMNRSLVFDDTRGGSASDVSVARSIASRDLTDVVALQLPCARPVNSKEASATVVPIARSLAVSEGESTSPMPLARSVASTNTSAARYAIGRSNVDSSSMLPLASPVVWTNASGTHIPMTRSVASSESPLRLPLARSLASTDASAARYEIKRSNFASPVDKTYASGTHIPMTRSIAVSDSSSQLPLARSVAFEDATAARNAISRSSFDSSSMSSLAASVGKTNASGTHIPMTRSIAVSNLPSKLPLARSVTLADTSAARYAISRSSFDSSSMSSLAAPFGKTIASGTHVPMTHSFTVNDASSPMPLARSVALPNASATSYAISRSNFDSSSMSPLVSPVDRTNASGTHIPTTRSFVASDSPSHLPLVRPTASSNASATHSVQSESTAAMPLARSVASPEASATHFATNDSQGEPISPMPLARSVALPNASATHLVRSGSTSQTPLTRSIASPVTSTSHPATSDSHGESTLPMPLARSVTLPNASVTHSAQSDSTSKVPLARSIASPEASATHHATNDSSSSMPPIPSASRIASSDTPQPVSHTSALSVKAQRPTSSLSRFPLRTQNNARPITHNNTSETNDIFTDRTAAQYGVLSPPAKDTNKVSETKAHETSNTHNPDPEELAEQAWRLILDKLAIEQERRGYTS